MKKRTVILNISRFTRVDLLLSLLKGILPGCGGKIGAFVKLWHEAEWGEEFEEKALFLCEESED